MDEISKTVAGAVTGSLLGLFGGRLFKRSDAMKELSDRVLILETTMQKHQEHDDQRFTSIEDKMQTFDKKLDSIHEEISGRFDRLTDLIIARAKKSRSRPQRRRPQRLTNHLRHPDNGCSSTGPIGTKK